MSLSSLSVSRETHFLYNGAMTVGSENVQIGAIGEAIAARYLVKHGFSIIARNFTVPGVGEIDLIAYKGGTFHFVEVKSSMAHGLTSEYHSSAHFDEHKKERVARVMRYYCHEQQIDSPRTVSLLSLYISRETHEARAVFEPYIMLDTI